VPGRASIETLEASRQGHTQDLAGKVKSGGAARAAPRCPETDPQGLKTKEGIEASGGLITRSGTSDRSPEENPEGEAVGSGVVGATRRQEKAGNDRRGRVADEATQAGRREQTPEW
jgi:hypothetical protein